ncbi:hypothetical protein AVDCRST_MAG82-1008, partial [uncultured Rubrobacteraceae bacterium]
GRGDSRHSLERRGSPTEPISQTQRHRPRCLADRDPELG